MKKILFSFLFLTIFVTKGFTQQDYSSFVNPFVDTGGHGHTYPGATAPHGMMQLSPDTRLTGWDGCGGYHYTDSFIYGFSHTHLSGTGIPDYGDVLLMPMTGEPSPKNTMYGSTFSHASEQASPGFYKVHLQDDDIDAAMTTTARAGMHQYHFNKNGKVNIVLDLEHRDEVLDSYFKIEDSVTISGLRRSKAWAQDQWVYFVIKFSEPFANYGVWKSDSLIRNTATNYYQSKHLKAYFQFDKLKQNDLYVKVALSAVSESGAHLNLQTEMPGWNFNSYVKNAREVWNKELGRIDVEGDAEKKKIFYTSLYHTAVVPNVYMDVDHQYRGRDNKIHTAEGFTYYTVFSLWDTYRAANPLYTIIDRERTLDYIKTFLAQYKQGGRLPVWELSANETECMIGYHSVAVIADAFAKGIKNFDSKLALEAMLHSANLDHFGLKSYKEKGFVASDDEQESVSRTLEYSYDDWCIAQFAKMTGSTAVYDSFMQRAQNFKNVLHPQKGFMQPRKNADWLLPFDPREVNSNYTEANAWQYSFYMPQNVGAYIKTLGGATKLEQKLDQLFTENSKTTGRDQSDITGLIGQYAHGNEPSHHIAYLYNAAGAPQKTQDYIHKICNEFYSNNPDGLIGNEDCGQMSAWYVLSSLGFYPVLPGSNQYELGTPAFTKATIHLENGRNFVIIARDVSDNNHFVKAAMLQQGKERTDLLHSLKISSDQINNGNILAFDMTANASSGAVSFMQPSNTSAKGFVATPVIHGGAVGFSQNKLVQITAPTGAKIFYSTANGIGWKAYTRAVPITSTTTLLAYAKDAAGNKSKVVAANYKKAQHNWQVMLQTPYEEMYNAGGAQGLVDGVFGDANWRRGNWQGYQKNNFEAVINLQKEQSVSKVTVGLLQDAGAWIVLPKKVRVFASVDGKDFEELASASGMLDIKDEVPQVKRVDLNFAARKAKYIKIIAEQYGKMPEWHVGAGGDTHIFIDEIEIK